MNELKEIKASTKTGKESLTNNGENKTFNIPFGMY